MFTAIGQGNSFIYDKGRKRGAEINLPNLNRFLSITDNSVSVQAGATLYMLVRELDRRGLALGILPEYLHMSVGACISIPIHSSSTKYSYLADLATEITYMKEVEIIHLKKGDSEWSDVIFSKDKKQIILDVTFNCEKRFYLEKTCSLHSDEILDDLQKIFYSNYSATLQWYVSNRKVLLINFNLSKNQKRKGFSLYLPRDIINADLAKINTFFKFRNKNLVVSELINKTVISKSILKFRNFSKLKSFELALPIEYQHKFFLEIKNEFENGKKIPFSIGIRFSPKSVLLNSPCYNNDCLWIGVRTAAPYWINLFKEYSTKFSAQFHTGKFIPRAVRNLDLG